MEISNMIRRRDVQKYFPILSPYVLKHWADAGKGPRYIIIGRNSYYEPKDIEKYITQKAITPDLESRRKRKVVNEILEGSPARRKVGRPRKKPTKLIVEAD